MVTSPAGTTVRQAPAVPARRVALFAAALVSLLAGLWGGLLLLGLRVPTLVAPKLVEAG